MSIATDFIHTLVNPERMLILRLRERIGHEGYGPTELSRLEIKTLLRLSGRSHRADTMDEQWDEYDPKSEDEPTMSVHTTVLETWLAMINDRIGLALESSGLRALVADQQAEIARLKKDKESTERELRAVEQSLANQTSETGMFDRWLRD